MTDKMKVLEEILGKFSTKRNSRAHTEISVGELRDAFLSMKSPYGVMYRSGSVEDTTPAPGAGDYVKANVNTSLASPNYLFTADTDNRLVYTGTSPRAMMISCSVSMTSSLSQVTVGFKIAVNDSVIDSSLVVRRINTNTDVGALSLQTVAILNTDDYIELWLTNETSATAIQVEEMNISVVGMFI